MLKDQIEKSQINNWIYERFAFHSEILGQDFHCGFFRQGPAAQITKTLYLFHGGGADDTQAVQAGLLPVLSKLLADHPDTQVVMPYIGNSFLHDHPAKKEKSFSNYFLEEILPACEAGTQTRAEGRFLCGWSMGGQAALNMFLRQAGKFAGVGVHFPTLVDFDYSDAKQAEAYAIRKNVTDPMMSVLVGEFQKEFLDKKDFNNHNPIVLAQKQSGPSLQKKKIYFDVGDADEFGLSEGGQILHKILDEKNVPHHFAVIPQGKHDGPFIHARIANMISYLL